ncbi:MAG: SDR family oxidoreductase [Rhodospirillaceae bacterium]|jgi:NAD(P)-dependent dehydrogenase (short-subunit alcohol dehydrogenase family)|nr:SDR family oxidoreductase [Rhodospirillaceae bacterium]
MSFAGKTIAVTGAASGIGATSATIIKAKGGKVIGLDLNEPAEGSVDQFIQYDQADAASIDAAAAALPASLDGLLNIAGVPPSAKFGPEKVLSINFIGLRQFTEAAVSKLSDGAVIVNMSSGAGIGWPTNIPNIQKMFEVESLDGVEAAVEELGIQRDGFENNSAYPFSKQCLSVWSMLVCTKWKDRGIRVNAVAPAAVETPIIGDFMDSFGADAVARMSNFGAATAENIANVATFLLTPEAVWINGAVVAADNGATGTATCKKNGLL